MKKHHWQSVEINRMQVRVLPFLVPVQLLMQSAVWELLRCTDQHWAVGQDLLPNNNQLTSLLKPSTNVKWNVVKTFMWTCKCLCEILCARKLAGHYANYFSFHMRDVMCDVTITPPHDMTWLAAMLQVCKFLQTTASFWKKLFYYNVSSPLVFTFQPLFNWSYFYSSILGQAMHRNRIHEDNCNRFPTGWMPFLSPEQQSKQKINSLH